MTPHGKGYITPWLSRIKIFGEQLSNQWCGVSRGLLIETHFKNISGVLLKVVVSERPLCDVGLWMKV